MDILKKTIEEFKQKYQREYIELSADPDDDMTVYQSKFGGVPYLPDNFEYPFSRLYPDKPLMLLAQINFEEMPSLEDFPDKGILQIYIAPDDDRFFGCDDIIRHFEQKELENQSEYRIIYHENIDYSADNSDCIPKMNPCDFPVSEPAKISFEKKTGYIPYKYGDENFDEAFLEIYNQYSEEDETELENIFCAEDVFSEYERHKIGGYQNDVWDSGWNNTDVLLLQIVSRDGIQIGDDGIAHFKITRDDLRSRNFSNVEYSWECY
jgi:uncharacterized protein YwqG